MISLDELENGDRLVLEDQFGYREEILKSGGSYGHKKGKVFGFTRDTGHIDKIKVLLEDGDDIFYVYEDDLKYWRMENLGDLMTEEEMEEITRKLRKLEGEDEERKPISFSCSNPMVERGHLCCDGYCRMCHWGHPVY